MMWIIRKRTENPQLSSNSTQHYLLANRTYIVGRKNADIIVEGDPSISRKHATFVVSKISNPNQLVEERLSITDTSKTGVFVNDKKLTLNIETELKEGDVVAYGSEKTSYDVIHHKLVVVTSCVNSSAAKTTVKSTVEALGGRTESNWSANSTLLVMDKVTFTIKVVGAIACAKPIVTVKYLEDLLDCCDKKKGLSLPDPTKYLPAVVEKSLGGQDLMFYPNAQRCSLMSGKLFLVLVEQQYLRIKEVIQYAGGEVALKLRRDAKLITGMVSSQTIVLQVEKKEEQTMNSSQVTWMREVYTALKKHKLRPIRESEIGLGIFNMSLEKHCNPTLSGAPMLTGNTHTQVMQESMCVNTQQTQPLHKPTPRVMDAATPELPLSVSLNESVHHTLPVVGDSSARGNVVNENGKRRMVSSSDSCSDSGNDRKEVTKMKKPKLKEVRKIEVAPILCEDVQKKEVKVLDEKPVSTNTCKNTPPSVKQQNNIIDIDDDDDEDDVFSVNFPKHSIPQSVLTMEDEPTMKTADLFGLDEDDEENEDSEKRIPDVVPVTPGLSNPPAASVAPSEVLFTPHSCKEIPETCFTAMSPGNDVLDKSRVPETCFSEIITPSRTAATQGIDKLRTSESCPLGVQESTCDEDDDSDDPFSFSVSAIKSSTAKNKKQKVTSHSERDSFLFKTRDASEMSSKKVIVSESDVEMNQTSTDDEMKQSRFRKAASSSQCSDVSQEVLLSDGDGNLVARDPVPKVQQQQQQQQHKVQQSVNGPKAGADMSYLLDGCDDDLDDVELSKEYHPQQQQQQQQLLLQQCAAPPGFISTRSTSLPTTNRLKTEVVENPDLIGIDTRNLVTLTVAKLVVKPQQNRVAPLPQASRSRLPNFKRFRKQQFIGRDVSVRLQVFESDNEERNAMFADICEKDEEEAAENRRIDQMFDVIPSTSGRKKR